MYDNYPIPFGKYKWTGLCRLPAAYLLGLYGNKKTMAAYPEIKSYIEANMDKLKNGNGIKMGAIPLVTMPCPKYLYLTENEARKELNRIESTRRSDDETKPIRHYYCDKCGGYHLTSKPLVK